MKKELKVSDNAAEEMALERVHRMARKKQDANRPRPIVAKFSNFKVKMAILDRGRELKDKPYSMNEQYPPEIVERRRKLLPIMKKNKEQNNKVHLNVDKLYINGHLFRDPNVTDWL